MPVVRTDEELINVLGRTMEKVVNDVAKWLLAEMKRIVEEEVYIDYHGKYKRLRENGGFLGSFQMDAAKFVSSYINTGIVESQVGILDPIASMELDYTEHQHGSIVGGDRRAILAQLIESGQGYDFGGNAEMERPFWNLIEEIIQDGSLDFMIERSMSKYGIQWQKIF